MEDNEGIASQNSDKKTSSTRRKLRIPQRYLHSGNKISPSNRRRSKRNAESVMNIFSKDKPLECGDKENTAYVTSNLVLNSVKIESGSLGGNRKQPDGKKSTRVNSENLPRYSPVVIESSKGKKKRRISEAGKKMAKILPLSNVKSIENSVDNEETILHERDSKTEGCEEAMFQYSPKNSQTVQLQEADKNDLKSQDTKISIERLSPKNEELTARSPVKVVNEKPLKIVAVLDHSTQSSTVARRINFDDISQKKISHFGNVDQDSELIQDSQNTTAMMKISQNTFQMKRGKKRRRGSNVSMGNATKRMKNSLPVLELEYETKKVEIMPGLEAKHPKGKKSCRIARNTALKVETNHRQDLEDNVTETIDASIIEEEKESLGLTSKNTEKLCEKQPAPKMRLNKYGESPLHVAVKRGDIDKVRSLLLDGVDVNSKDHAGWRPIHEAMREGEYALDIISLLVDYGADINAKSETGNTALHDATAYMSEEIIKYLVENGANPTILNVDGKSPLDIAKMPQYERSKYTVQLLSSSSFETGNAGPKQNEKSKQRQRKKILERYVVANQMGSLETSNDNDQSHLDYKTESKIQIDKEALTEDYKDRNEIEGHTMDAIYKDMQSEGVKLDENESETYKSKLEIMSRCSNEEPMVCSTAYVKSQEENKNKFIYTGNMERDNTRSLKFIATPFTKSSVTEKNPNNVQEPDKVEETSNEQKLPIQEDRDVKLDSVEIHNTERPISITSETTCGEVVISTLEQLNGKTMNCQEQQKTIESPLPDLADTSNSNKTNVASKTNPIKPLLKRQERRTSLPCPIGPSSRGARLLEMANKKSKSFNSCSISSLPTTNTILNNSFTDLNSSGGSSAGSEITSPSGRSCSTGSSVLSMSKYILMSPRIESKQKLCPLLPYPAAVEKASINLLFIR